MVGLTPATSGTATIAGRRFADLPNPGLEVGVLLDASAQHAGRTGREILTIAQRTMGLPAPAGSTRCSTWSASPPTRPSRRVRNYSLGMRQRLGIATALIGDPEVLILDEPANGLDPAGIRWMRDLLRDYADRGGTVLLSSHLLHEIEVIADDIVVIGNGRIVAQGTKAELLQAAGTVVRAAGPRPTSPGPCDAGRRRRHARPATAPCAPTPTPTLVGTGRPRGRRRPHRAARRRRRRASRRCSSSSPPTPNEKEQQHDRHRPSTQAVEPHGPHRRPAGIPLTRIIAVELRKMFDTRSGFWLMASIVITRRAGHRRRHPVRPGRRAHLRHLRRGDRLPDGGHPADDRDPVGHQRVEPAQRPDDVHPGPAPRPGDRAPRRSPRSSSASSRCCSRSAIGALGNVVGTAITGTDLVWDVSVADARLHHPRATCWACWSASCSAC